ncbi:helix-turn-helix domain-containing protein [Janibacter cremeus]|uniref:helix-turn-helix transcriptional regulator n=1 Tax=Janibacter cremeus TaxID=1285192 RepID=UPI0023F61D11|nr:helix-turn-helix domain-containing protein [Janibacter cremeus]WEV77127.1 helix-turn-helix domain-containing protein [Janibacter cremeus]
MENTNLGPEPAPEADPSDLGAAVRQVLEALRAGGRPMRVTEIAASVGSHENTVRSHLTQLLERSLVTADTAPSEGRGRPAVLYEAGPRPGVRVDEYRALAGAFAADLVASEGGPQVRDRARRIGRAWGERLAAPGTTVTEREHLDSTLADLGFGPVRDGATVRLTTCPLLDLAVENPDVICQVHLGLVDGTLRRGDDDEPAELTPFAEPGACLLRVPER